MPNQAYFDAMTDAQFEAWWDGYIAGAESFERIARGFERATAWAKRWGYSSEGEV